MIAVTKKIIIEGAPVVCISNTWSLVIPSRSLEPNEHCVAFITPPPPRPGGLRLASYIASPNCAQIPQPRASQNPPPWLILISGSSLTQLNSMDSQAMHCTQRFCGEEK
jgi:hypothetical protein